MKIVPKVATQNHILSAS